MTTRRWPLAVWAAGGLLFAVLATANAGGYRYGASDQAFYIPVVLRALNPAAFPRDGALIDAQGRLMLLDEAGAAIVRSTGMSLESVFLSGYLLSLALVWIALVLIGTRVFRSPWATVALAAAFTLRHRIPRTSANSFEPYFYPRMLAFGIGLLAISAILHRRLWTAIGLVAAAAVVHITTGMWFAVLIGVAVIVLEPRMRRPAAAAAVASLAVATIAFLGGPLAAASARMDDEWLMALASKDSLFPSDWPLWAWAVNLALPAVLWWIHRRRQASGEATPADGALCWGAVALAATFVASVPLVAAHWTLPTQLQISRVFWLVDFVLLVYMIALLVDWRPGRTMRWPAVAAGILLTISVSRAIYVMRVEFPERSLFEVRVRPSPWQDAMAWLGRGPIGAHVLADPGHAWRYGTSVRVAAGRDVFLEETKDSALAIYSRDVAMRVTERLQAIGNFAELTPERARELAGRYSLDYLVTEASMPLALAYENGTFRVYALNDRHAAGEGDRP